MYIREEQIPCTECGTLTHWLELFVGNLCLTCHAQQWTPPPADYIKRMGQ